MQLDFIRGDELKREQISISANLYNHIHLLFSKTDGEALFVPIRSMAYLAIIDNEEVIFVDSQRPRLIEISWRAFRPGLRTGLNDPVTLDCVYYILRDEAFMYRLHSALLKSLQTIAARLPRPEASVIELKKGRKPD